VLNEPENSLHPELVPALARLIIRASEHTQVWVVSHSSQLVAELQGAGRCQLIELDRPCGETEVRGQDLLNTPTWKWPD
jgi:predicted ATPase